VPLLPRAENSYIRDKHTISFDCKLRLPKLFFFISGS